MKAQARYAGIGRLGSARSLERLGFSGQKLAAFGQADRARQQRVPDASRGARGVSEAAFHGLRLLSTRCVALGVQLTFQVKILRVMSPPCVNGCAWLMSLI